MNKKDNTEIDQSFNNDDQEKLYNILNPIAIKIKRKQLKLKEREILILYVILSSLILFGLSSLYILFNLRSHFLIIILNIIEILVFFTYAIYLKIKYPKVITNLYNKIKLEKIQKRRYVNFSFFFILLYFFFLFFLIRILITLVVRMDFTSFIILFGIFFMIAIFDHY